MDQPTVRAAIIANLVRDHAPGTTPPLDQEQLDNLDSIFYELGAIDGFPVVAINVLQLAGDILGALGHVEEEIICALGRNADGWITAGDQAVLPAPEARNRPVEGR